ncbi:phosphomannomutase/phosphoglucomutase [Candidatus Babeliales bacterium]|nr:phosphomannomutase/phosphoglucomutase [Candidatus Babeliales bacterium]
MNSTIFRKYDIRGIVGKDFSVEESLDISKGIISHILTKTPDLQTLAIAMDGRTHSPAIKEKVLEACTSLGVDAIDLGLIPTPALSHHLFTSQTTSGIMITASHNPKEYNGFKVFHGQQAFWNKEIKKIAEIVETKNFKNPASYPGKVIKQDAISPYIAWFHKNFMHLVAKDFKCAIDCCGGAASTVVPLLIEVMKWKHVITINDVVDGTFSAHEADPTREENIQQLVKTVKENNLDFGIGFDGDADRMAPVTHSGQLVLGDRMVALFGTSILQRHPGATIIYDIKGSGVINTMIKAAGGNAIMSETGSCAIRDRMQCEGAILGGEVSCHFFFRDRFFGYDDGIYAALRLMELLLLENKRLSELVKEMPPTVSTNEIKLPYKKRETAEKIISSVQAFFSKKVECSVVTIDGARVQTPIGWGLIRASNTEPHLSLRFESDTIEHLKQLQESFMEALENYYPTTTLEKHFSQ